MPVSVGVSRRANMMIATNEIAADAYCWASVSASDRRMVAMTGWIIRCAESASFEFACPDSQSIQSWRKLRLSELFFHGGRNGIPRRSRIGRDFAGLGWTLRRKTARGRL